MSHVFKDRVLETTTTTGTGTLTLGGAVTGFQSFSAVGDGNECFYSIWAVDGDGNPSGAWEVGIGTYTASGTTLSRDTILASSNSGAAVNFGAGTKHVAVVNPADRVGLPDIQVFTSSGTWTKPAGCQTVKVFLVGGGCGGNSGRRAASGSRLGGGGGGCGGVSITTLDAGVCGTTETVTVGAGGAGAAGVTTDDTNGNIGSAGGSTTFGSLAFADGGPASAISYSNGNVAGDGMLNVGAGTSGSTSASAATRGGGGGGGSISTSNVSSPGGAGGPRAFYDNAGAGAAGTADGGNGGNGGSVANTILSYGGGGGGGGGGPVAGGTGGTGGNGGYPGGGGGGGGGCLNGSNSGAGGNGANGICVVISW